MFHFINKLCNCIYYVYHNVHGEKGNQSQWKVACLWDFPVEVSILVARFKVIVYSNHCCDGLIEIQLWVIYFELYFWRTQEILSCTELNSVTNEHNSNNYWYLKGPFQSNWILWSLCLKGDSWPNCFGSNVAFFSMFRIKDRNRNSTGHGCRSEFIPLASILKGTCERRPVSQCFYANSFSSSSRGIFICHKHSHIFKNTC